MITEYSITNFKAFAGQQTVKLKPITLVYGQNSSGKSSLLQSLLLLKQTIESSENPEMLLLPKGNLVDLGGFREFINAHDVKKPFAFEVRMPIPKGQHFFPSVLMRPLEDLKIETLGFRIELIYDEQTSAAALSLLTLFLGNNYHLTDEKCAICPNIVALAPRAIVALEYFISDFSRRRRDRLSYVLGDGKWNKTDFEREILKPIFDTAKHIKIFDRWIGKSAFNKHRGTVQFNRNYKRTLEWIIQVFKNVGGAGRGGIFEIYCGIEGGSLNARQSGQLKSEMQKFEAAIRAATAIPVQIILKNESNTSKCPHGRYLVTDQVSVLIDRGFDLLWDDAKMQSCGLNPAIEPRRIRDVAVVLCSDCNQIDAQTRALPPL